MSVINKGSLFPAEIEKQLFSKVKGHSSIAKMSAQDAIPFNGKDVFVFDFSNDISIVGESGAKPGGDGTMTSVQIRPIKVVYQMRTSQEFMTASEEYQIGVLQAFSDGFAAKLAAGLDKMALHGINPASGAKSTAIGNNYLDYLVANYNSGSNVITYAAASVDGNIESALDAVADAEYMANGVMISPATRTAISALSATGSGKGKAYPEFAFGQAPAQLGNAILDVNPTVAKSASDSTLSKPIDHAIVGDFASAFRWGIARNLPLEVIEYGDPDNSGSDLKGHNQILLRSEAFIGWGFLDAAAFAVVASAS